MPANGVRAEHVAEESGNVAQLVRVVAVDGVVVLCECLLKEVGPEPVDLGKSLGNETVELGVRLLLRTALDDHGGHLGLHAGWELKLHQLVGAFLGVHARHDG